MSLEDPHWEVHDLKRIVQLGLLDEVVVVGVDLLERRHYLALGWFFSIFEPTALHDKLAGFLHRQLTVFVKLIFRKRRFDFLLNKIRQLDLDFRLIL